MATVQQFIHWLKREKSKGGCIKMATPDVNPSHDSSSADDSYGMKRLLQTELNVTMDTPPSVTITTEHNKVLEQFSTAPCRASMKLPPIPREEGRQRWVPTSPRRICSDSPAHIYEEIPWSAVETDYDEEAPDSNANNKNQTDRNTTNNRNSGSVRNSQGLVKHKQGCEPYMVVQLTNNTLQQQQLTHNSSLQQQQLIHNSSLQQQQQQQQQIAPGAKTDNHSSNNKTDNSAVAPEVTCVDHLLADDGLEKYAGNFVQCTKCNRPHGLFNGTQIKHFDEHNEVGGGGDVPTFDRLSVRTRSVGPFVTMATTKNNNTSTVSSTLGFHRDTTSNKFGPKVRTNPRVSERNFKFTRSTSLDSSQIQSQSQTSDGVSQPMESRGTSHVVTKVQESDSADTCNEYDIHTGSDLSSRSSGKGSSCGSNMSQRSSIASDSAASNLYGSESSHDSPNSRQISRKLNESDSSNDTFSEYDIRSSDSYSSSKGMADEYDFYLNKIRQNLMFKHETLRVIRESESSEYETSEYQTSSRASSAYTTSSLSDVSIMTSRGNGDVSNCSAFNENTRDVKLKGILKNSSKSCSTLQQNRPKRSIVIKDDVIHHKSRGSHTLNPSVHARKKPNRRKSTGTLPSALECYTLPDFGSDSVSGVPEGPKRSSSPADGSACLDSSVVSSGSDSDILERLSCRATNYKPDAPPLAPSSGGSVSSLGGSSSSAFTKVTSSAKSAIPKVPASAPVVTRAPARAHAQSRPQHNRLLTDIMKINHDRQLLFL